MISINAKNIVIKKGITAILSFSMLIFPMLQPTNKFTPTGGVRKPMDAQMIITIPKWIGCIPNSVAIGSSNGVKISMFANASIKVPMTRRKINIIAINTYLFSDMLNRRLTSISGTLLKRSIWPRAVAVATTRKMDDVVNAVPRKISQIFSNDKVLRIAPSTIKAYTTAITPASVGVVNHP